MAQSKGITKITMSRETYLKYIDMEKKYKELQVELLEVKKRLQVQEDDEEEEDTVHCVGCGEFVCKFTEEPPYKDDRDEAVCEECYIELHEEEVCELCGGQNEKEASCRVSEYGSYILCDNCVPPDDICSVKEWNERWTKKGKDTFDFDTMEWKEGK